MNCRTLAVVPIVLSLSLLLSSAWGVQDAPPSVGAPVSIQGGLPAPGASEPLPAPRNDAEIEEAIEGVLGMRHPTDTPDWWRGLGPSAPRVIMGMFGKSSHIYRRLRLLQALGWFDDPAATEFLKQQGRTTQEDVLRNASIKSLGISRGAKELDYISGFLTHSDPQTRLVAAQAVKVMDDERARQLLERFREEEKTPWVLSRLQGEPLPRAVGPLIPAASNEDRLSPEFVGNWRGFWIAPRMSNPKDPASVRLVSEPLIVKLSLTREGALQGELQRRSAPLVPAKWVLDRSAGKSTRVSGFLLQAEKVSTPASLAFEATLRQESGGWYLEFRLPGRAELLVLRREVLK